jgi:hypothetical protein
MANTDTSTNNDTPAAAAAGVTTSTTDGSTEHAVTSRSEIETAVWTRHLPQAFGIRHTVQASKYRWCVREAALWGIATGTAMTLHRFRMLSFTQRAVNVGFFSFMTVYGGSYFFCVKRRDYREEMIQLMMQLNRFEPLAEMPQPMPVNEHHPFVQAADVKETTGIPNKQYIANLPERKEWQPQLPTQDADRVFQPVSSSSLSK